MKFIKNLIILTITFVFHSNSLAKTQKNDCTLVKNFAKKMECKLKNVTKGVTSKVDSTTKSITSKKSLADFFKKEKK